MTISGSSDDEILLFNNTEPLESNWMLFRKNTLTYKATLIKKKSRLIKKNVLQKTIIAKFEVIENFYSDFPRKSNKIRNQITKF